MTSLHLSRMHGDDALPPRLAEIVERRMGQTPIKLDFKTVLAIVSLASAIFTAGYNWRDVVALREIVTLNADENKQAHETFVRKDVNDQHFDSVQRQLTEIKDALAQLNVAARRTR